MLMIIFLPILGFITAAIVNAVFQKAKFRGYDVLPFFFIVACQNISSFLKNPSFLPYGFLTYFVLVLVISISRAIKFKNIDSGKLFRKLWDYLTVCTIFWYIGLLFTIII